MADAGFGRGVRICGGAIPCAFVDEAFEAACPLVAKFVDVVGAHLVDDEKDDELGARSGGGSWLRPWFRGLCGGRGRWRLR